MKNRYYDGEVMDTLEIDTAVVRHEQYKAQNKDNGNFVKTNAWKPLIKKNENAPLKFDVILY